MTLRQLRAAYPHLFYANQDWFDAEAFMDVDLVPLSVQPVRAIPARTVPDDMLDELTDAVLLAQCYVKDPHNTIWKRWLWTGDVDRYGQRVYLGNPHGNGLEIHRHLHIDHKWSIPIFS